MKHSRPGDLLLARLLARPAYRWTLYVAFFLTATATLYLRVGEGRTEQVLPWYGVFLSIYGFGMAAASSDGRCRTAYVAFGLLVAAAFSRDLLAAHARWVGVVEVACCLVLLVFLSRLARDPSFMAGTAMLEFESPAARNGNEDSRDEGGMP